MGCSSSKEEDPAARLAAGSGAMTKATTKNNDSSGNGGTEKRIDSIDETRTANFGSVKVRYAYLSQRGYYPEDANKPNQDAYSVTHDFCGQSSDAYFGVYDGHGRDGDKCAQFARDNLPDLVAKHVKKTKLRESKLLNAKDKAPALELTKDQIQAACLKAHVECNRDMHRSHDLDDSLSGTTSISIYLHGRRNRITICNVGDSRAIMGQKVSQDGAFSLRAMPLSRDQTPYRRDERARVKATGARILSLDQIEGLEPIDDDDDAEGDLELGEELDEGGDPPRVWSPHGEYPGTAFTRSLGDAIAEELGVFAEPEMLTRELTDDDQIIVIASDGVFEFLTNQSVIDICAKFSDPLEACRAVVAESYELWLQYELRTDDITIICMFVDAVKPVSQSFMSGSGSSSRAFVIEEAQKQDSVISLGTEEEDTVDELVSFDAVRPVRTHISKEKSNHLQKMKTEFSQRKLAEGFEDEEVDLSALYTEKTEEDKAGIAEAIRASVMFKDITDEQREMIYGVMESISVKKGTWIIKQGTVGDRFYIVDTGRFEVRIVPEGQEDKDGSGGNVVHVYEGSREKNAHPSFGELALMYSAPRAASVIAETDGQLWALHRYAFRQVLAEQTERKELVRTLTSINILKNLEKEKINNLAAAMDEVTFGRGETIIEQGEVGDALFVILAGACEFVQKEGKEVRNATLKTNDFFGEEVLVDERRYAATVVALQTTCCWKLDKATLKQTVGSLKISRKTSKDNVA